MRRAGLAGWCIVLGLGAVPAHAVAGAPEVEYTPLDRAEDVPGLERVPHGEGAVLVPALTRSTTEPLWQLLDGSGKKVASTLTGHAIAAAPAMYTAEIGSGSGSQLIRVPVEVCAGELTRVRPTWGALVVHTLDEEETPFRGLYVLFEFLTRDSYGFGRGAEEESGEHVEAWLLEPSIYKIVGALESFDARTNFTTLKLAPGEVMHYVIVMDRESGDFRGSGIVPSDDFTVRGSITGRVPRVQAGGFKVKALVGADFSQNASDNVLGLQGSSIGIGLFTDFSVNYLWKKHFLNLFINLAGGVRKNSDESFVRKVRDELGLSGIYIYQVWPRLGQYVRVSIRTQFANSVLHFDKPTLVQVRGEEPETVEELKVSRALDPMLLSVGGGFNLRVFKNVRADLDARLGTSIRVTRTKGFLVVNDDPKTDAVEYDRVGQTGDLGGEMALLGSARLGQLASYRLNGDVFVSKGDWSLDLEHTISIRLIKSLSVGVLFELRRDDTTGERLGFSEAFFLRASQRVF
jgi:DUF3078 family protein